MLLLIFASIMSVGRGQDLEATLSFGEVDLVSQTIAIHLENSDPVSGFQFEVIGLNLSNGGISGGSAEANGFFVTIGENNIVLGYSTTTFPSEIPIGNDVLTYIEFDGFTDGLTCNAICLSEGTIISGYEIPLYFDVSYGDCILLYSKGDINTDDALNVLDIVQLLNIIFETSDPDVCQIWAADFNSDGDMNIMDIVQIVNTIFINDDCLEGYDCLGLCGGAAVVDCAGECGGSAVLSGCDNTCNSTAVFDCSGECGGSAIVDCADECGGSAIVDCADECGGSAIVDCADECGGGAVVDCADECGGTSVLSGCDNVCNSTAMFDCSGECGGSAVLSGCDNLCGSTAVDDCAGECGGGAVVDCAGECGGSAVLSGCDNLCGSTAVDDCAGECGGGAVDDDSDGICNDVDDCIGIYDCSGECGGSAVLSGCDNTCNSTAVFDCSDECGGSDIPDCADVCDGTAIVDCAGECGGSAVVDCAGECGGSAVLSGCDNVCNSTAVEDECGVCGGDGVDADSDGICDDVDNCIGTYDCSGQCNGLLVNDECGVCDGDGSSCVCDYDDNCYEVVQIGTQLWMAENLRVTHYNDGIEIPNITNNGDWGSLSAGAYGVYNNDPLNAVIYGNLYNWYTVDDDSGLCPAGWHVPSDEEFIELEMFLGMSESEANDTGYRGTNEGSKLAGSSGLWNDGNLENNSEFGTSGFTAHPGGYRSYSNGTYQHVGVGSYFWLSSESSSTDAWYRIIYFNNSSVTRYDHDKQYGSSIRCLRD
jgi:uncharacterized protein (TIGR02145 family)